MRLRRIVKSGLAQAISRAESSGLFVSTRSKAWPVVIAYHRVVEDFATSARAALPQMLISCRMLEQHLDWLTGRFHLVGLDEIGARLAAGEPFDRPIAAITFDDGYRGLYDQAFRLLKRRKIPAAVFVVTDLVSDGGWQTHDRLYCLLSRAFARWAEPERALTGLLMELQLGHADPSVRLRLDRDPVVATGTILRALAQGSVEQMIAALELRLGPPGPPPVELSPLTWEMLGEMAAAGFTIGSHSRTHAWLTNESAEKVADETSGSRKELERHIGIRIEHFAYPDGRFNRATVEAVGRAGYRFAYTTCHHRDANHPLLTMPRQSLWEHSSIDASGMFDAAILNCQVHRLFPTGESCRQRHAA